MRRSGIAALALVACGRFDFAASDGGATGDDAPVCTAADFQTDPANCGACGHSCLGGACAGGACQPVALATGQLSPFGIAVDANTVYWANNDLPAAFASCAKTGCGDAPTLLTGAEPLPAAVFVRGSDLYLSEYGDPSDMPMVASAIKHCTVGDCAATLTTVTLAEPGGAVSVVANATDIYFTDDQGGSIETVVFGGASGTPTTFATDTAYGPWYGLAIDAQNLYFTSRADGVFRCALGSGTCTALATTTATDYAWSLAIDATTVYWTENMSGSVRSCPITGCPQAGPTVIASGQGSAKGIAVDGQNVYWLDSGPGTVMRCPLGGCVGVPETLAANQIGLWEITLDADAIYWTASGNNADGTVMKLAKPM